ncbi:MAG: hypothetical protein V2G48_02605 [bacterium JZ-2024 1]
MDILRTLHLLFVSVWVGGNIFIGLLLIPFLKRKLELSERLIWVAEIGEKFVRVVWLSLLGLLLTGSGMIFLRGFQIPWRIFAEKMFLLVLLIFLTYQHSYLLGSRMKALASSSSSWEREYTKLSTLSLWTSLLSSLLQIVIIFLGTRL